MVHILQHTLLPTNTHIINRAQMLRIFRQPNTARMWHNRDTEFLCHQEDGEDFVDAAHAAGVDLADVDGARGEELLKDYAILTHFAGGDADAVGAESFSDSFVAEDVVGGGGFFDEPGFEFFEMLHVGDCFGDGPNL